jgi:hypothetical protein
LDLYTHWFFGFAIGLVFFGRPEIAFLIGLGALIPDLDREYWFIPAKQYRDEQLHRALFHNVFIMAVAYLGSPFLSLGIFLHTLLDSFTTVKDRGCEWFFPVTRWVKRGRKDADGHDEPLDPTEHVYFYQEDPNGLLENPNPDLRKHGDRPVPWRRTYGPALNSQLLDRGFLFGSIAIILIWSLVSSGFEHLDILKASLTQNYLLYLVGYVSVAMIFASGKLDSRTRAQSLTMPGLALMKSAALVAGIALAGYGIILCRMALWMNLEAVDSNWLSVILGVLVVALASMALIKWQTRDGKITTV